MSKFYLGATFYRDEGIYGTIYHEGVNFSHDLENGQKLKFFSNENLRRIIFQAESSARTFSGKISSGGGVVWREFPERGIFDAGRTSHGGVFHAGGNFPWREAGSFSII